MSVIARFCSAEQMRLISANYLTVLSASHGNHNFNHHLWAKDDRVPIMRWYDSGSVCWNVAWSKKGQYKHQPAIQTPTRQRGLCCKEQTKPLLTDVRDKSMLHCRTLNLQHMVCKVCYQGIVGLRLLWALRNRHSGERLHPSATRARLQFTAPDSRPDETWIELRSAPKGSHPRKSSCLRARVEMDFATPPQDTTSTWWEPQDVLKKKNEFYILRLATWPVCK